MKSCRRGGMADALGSGPSSFTGVRVQLPPSAPDFVSGGRSERIRPVNDCAMRKSVRVWHNGCAPAFQAGYTGSTPVTRSNYGGIPEWPKGADCKSASTAFDGSNPSPTTIFELKTATIVAIFYHIRFQFPTDGLF